MNNSNKILLLITCILLAIFVFVGLRLILDNADRNDTSTNSEAELVKETNDSTTDPESHHDDEDLDHTHANETTEQVSVLDSPYMGSYIISDSDYGTEVEVTLTNSTREITANSLPNHETDEFPNRNNPNEISAQSKSYSLPLYPIYKGDSVDARDPGVGINGVAFEPGTAENTTCETGELYRIAGLQDTIDLGMDMNNAHVQPTGEYHYHGTPTGLVDFVSAGSDLVHVGFAMDGYLMYYSLSGNYESSYRLSTEERSGTNCTTSGPGGDDSDVEGTTPDGTYEEDWVYDASYGNLDECNGTEIDGQYVYVVTDEYPFVGRCMMGEYTSTQGPGGGGGGTGPTSGQGSGGDNRPLPPHLQ